MILELYCTSHNRTQAAGEKLGSLISSRMTMALHGDLGAGKTTFVQGIAKGLGVPDTYYVTSPTYTLINEYPGRVPLYHMDLYRLGDIDELEYLGFDEIISSPGAIVVEWPEILGSHFVKFDLDITIKTDKAFNRKIIIKASGLDGTNLLRELSV
ncbi:tRNA threonylcarbamoyladenosine biosynthesis protein TsaE [Desulfocicer vacuolatum DSM 3385]|uniref:tRNA threonylcarbamoyladenosine biosynthesis protein TsaE n=1 Tax=Desulfocicer vacuolatum DSM 3385 TaxID=1121400 RepID=A0A1W1YHK7_9BACT|nr:tRNA (adenosine(37)-N6)-threonylcarbamoyltransferase complex ATPase subunit type 1 TsaE [Desulfocicer vacuolatum]SMC35667.1 tRNA threonylcarbamoyladenosine biosynthesis protein TsaE [Desulfocicer vacuolatum DSM 3385]